MTVTPALIASQITSLLPDNTTRQISPSDVRTVLTNINAFASVAQLVTVSATTYTISSADLGLVLNFTSASAIAVRLPNDLAAGFSTTLVVSGAGQVTLSVDTGGTLNNIFGYTKSAGPASVMSLLVTSNTDNASASYILTGNTAP